MNESDGSLEQTESTEQSPVESRPAGDGMGVDDASASPVSHAGALLLGVKLPIRVLLGRTQLCLRDVAQLGSGSVVELDCSPDDPVELMVNDRVIAHGEVVVIGGNYGVRITGIAGGPGNGDPAGANDLLSLSERLKG